MRRLKASEVSGTRASLLIKQGGKCALCQLTCGASQAVLDHDHHTGVCRGAIHRGCNSLLGKVENNAARYGVRELSAFLHGAAAYLKAHEVDCTGLLHPTHKTDEEKRVRRNAKARVARAKKRSSDAIE